MRVWLLYEYILAEDVDQIYRNTKDMLVVELIFNVILYRHLRSYTCA